MPSGRGPTPPSNPAALGPAGPFPPPPGGMPPPFFLPPSQPARGPGVLYALLIGLATSIFIGSLLLNLVLLVAAAASAGTAADPNDIPLVEQTVVDGNANEKIAVVRLDGMIAERTKREFVLLLDKVARDPTWRALVIEIDSPGGGVTASDEMYDAVLRLKQQRQIPVVISMNSVAASGGYYVAMAGDRILAQETTLTGSIGVILSRYDLSELGQKYGVKDGSIVADGSTYKNAGSMLRPLTPDEEQYLKSIANDAFATFKGRIAKGRPKLTTSEIETASNGKIYSAHQALELKLIDKIGYLDDAVIEAATLAGLSRPKAIRVERSLSILEQLAGGAGVAASGQPADARAGVLTSITPEAIEAFTRPRLMYLWSGN